MKYKRDNHSSYTNAWSRLRSPRDSIEIPDDNTSSKSCDAKIIQEQAVLVFDAGVLCSFLYRHKSIWNPLPVPITTKELHWKQPFTAFAMTRTINYNLAKIRRFHKTNIKHCSAWHAMMSGLWCPRPYKQKPLTSLTTQSHLDCLQ